MQINVRSREQDLNDITTEGIVDLCLQLLDADTYICLRKQRKQRRQGWSCRGNMESVGRHTAKDSCRQKKLINGVLFPPITQSVNIHPLNNNNEAQAG